MLYAGTETGAYVSFNDGEWWQPLKGNLPPVVVMQMRVKDDDLVVATHGRGFWILDNISALRSITPDIAEASIHLFEVAPAFRHLRGGRGWSGLFGGAKNPARGVTFEYYLANAARGPVTITISENGGEIVKQFSSNADNGPSADGGMNRFVWNMRYPGTVMPPPNGALDGFMSVDYSPPTSPVAAPGEYRVRLTVDGNSYEQLFEIQKDPRIKASDEDLVAQFKLMVEIRDQFTEVSDTVLRIRDIRTVLNERRPDLPANSGAEADAILEELREIEGILMIWMGSAEHPMMWSPPGLTEKLSSLSGAVNSGDARPTDSMYAVFTDLRERFEVQRKRLNQIVDNGLAPSALDEQ